eukprot:GILI01005426.1.p1 GENE.GILI01005426.1~~GILI01005426.1.p1  ORF type:complete len:612 (-),score=228.29 GILI01005426.1:143-1978(-)
MAYYSSENNTGLESGASTPMSIRSPLRSPQLFPYPDTRFEPDPYQPEHVETIGETAEEHATHSHAAPAPVHAHASVHAPAKVATAEVELSLMVPALDLNAVAQQQQKVAHQQQALQQQYLQHLHSAAILYARATAATSATSSTLLPIPPVFGVSEGKKGHEMVTMELGAVGQHAGAAHHALSKEEATFYPLFTLLMVGLMVLYGTCTEYIPDANGDNMNLYYKYVIDVSYMVFVGFGFLMTFLRRYGYSAVGFTFFISTFTVLWGILVQGFFHLIKEGHWQKIQLDGWLLVQGLFAAATVMITFGGLIGKASPTQLLAISFFEVILYSINTYIGYDMWSILDVGGSMFIHTFGAYFGLVCCLILNRKSNTIFGTPQATARTSSDLFAMIGTVFLWMCWPSFNAATAAPSGRMRVAVNTMLSLCSSCVFSFVTSKLFSEHKKFDMVHVQNSTLAGGVAVGAAADMFINPGGAMAIGAVAGIVSVLGYIYLTPLLKRTLKLDDTCGIHNLHGMPGLIGSFAQVIVCAAGTKAVYGAEWDTMFKSRTAFEQAQMQLASLGVTLGLAIGGAIVTATLAKIFAAPKTVGEDDEFWVTADDYSKLIQVQESSHSKDA